MSSTRLLLQLSILFIAVSSCQCSEPVLKNIPGIFINPTPSAAEMRYVAYGAGRYVASGLYKTRSSLITSVDGLQWTEIPLDPSFSVRPNGTCYYQVAYNDKDGFIALPASGHPGSLICFILKSADGLSWSALPGMSTQLFGESLVTLPGIFLSSGTNKQDGTAWPALYSTDGGLTWVDSPRGCTGDRQTTVVDGYFVMLSDPTVAYRSKDGANWETFLDLSNVTLKNGKPILRVSSIYGSKQTGLFALALSAGRFDPRGSILLSLDGGKTWNEIFSFEETYYGTFSRAEGQTQTMFLNYVSYLDHWGARYTQARSDNGGYTWSTISRDNVKVQAAGKAVFVLGNDGLLAVSQGSSAPLTRVNEGIAGKIDNIVWSSSLNAFVAGTEGGIYVSPVGAPLSSWSQLTSQRSKFFQEIHLNSSASPLYVGLPDNRAAFNASFDLQKWQSFSSPVDYCGTCEAKGIAYSRKSNTWVVPLEWYPPKSGAVPDFYFFVGDGLPSSWRGGNWPKGPRISWPTSIISDRGIFLVMYYGADGFGVLSSTNGTEWTWASAVKLHPMESNAICRVTSVGEYFFAYCMESDTSIYASRDGFVWTPFQPANLEMLGHMIAMTVYPATSSSPQPLYTYKGRYMWAKSYDLINWTEPLTPPNPVTFFDIQASSGSVTVHASSFDNSIFVQK